MDCKHSTLMPPMRYYKFLTRFALIAGALLNTVNTISFLLSEPFWLDAMYYVAVLVLNIAALILLNLMNWRGVLSLCGLYLLGIGYHALCIVLYVRVNLDWAELFGRMLAYIVIVIPTWIYFRKRRHLFSPQPLQLNVDTFYEESATEEFSKQTPPPIIPESPPLQEKSQASPVKRRRLFQKFETYIVCPECGCLVPKNTCTCDCGCHLESLSSKARRKFCTRLRFFTPYLIALLIFSFGVASGYYMGQEEMKPQLHEQYEAGQEVGYSSGFRNGIKKGYADGVESTNVNSAKSWAFEDGYRTAMNDSGHFSATSSEGLYHVKSNSSDFYEINLVYLRNEYGISNSINTSSKPASHSDTAASAPSPVQGNPSGRKQPELKNTLDQYGLDQYGLDQYGLNQYGPK